MAGKKREKVRDEDVTGLKYFDKLQPLLKRLHEVRYGKLAQVTVLRKIGRWFS
jgi:hypothetical protein